MSMSSVLIRLSLEVNENPDFFVFGPISNHSRKEKEVLGNFQTNLN